MIAAASSSVLAGIGSARAGMPAAIDWSSASDGKGEGGPRIKSGVTVGGSSDAGANSSSCRFSAGAFERESAWGSSSVPWSRPRRSRPRSGGGKWPGQAQGRCRAEGRGSPRPAAAPCPSRSAARAMSMSRKVRPIRKLDASAATFLASLASRWVAMTPASPRLRPRHIKLVIADSEARRTSSATSPPPAGANSCASSTTTSAGYQWSRGASNSAERKAAAQRICPSASSPSRLSTTEARCSRIRAGQPGDVALAMVGGLDRDMAVAVGERDEIAFGIDHDLLDLARALFEQAAQQVRLSAARIALHQQAGRQQLFQVDRDGVALPVDAHVHAHRHCRTSMAGRGTRRQACASATGNR